MGVAGIWTGNGDAPVLGLAECNASLQICRFGYLVGKPSFKRKDKTHFRGVHDIYFKLPVPIYFVSRFQYLQWPLSDIFAANKLFDPYLCRSIKKRPVDTLIRSTGVTQASAVI